MSAAYARDHKKPAVNGRGPRPGRGVDKSPAAMGRTGNAASNGRLAAAEPSLPRQTVGFSAPNERLLFYFANAVGYNCNIQLKNGMVYQGVFHAANVHGQEVNLVAQFAKVLKPASDGSGPLEGQMVRQLVLYSGDWVSMEVTDMRLGEADVGPAGAEEGGFVTDAAISRGRGGLAGRELQRWVPEDDSGALELEGEAFEDGDDRGWDQFAANQRKFGVRTTYDEELYTTKLDKRNSRISEAEAGRIAAEIQAGITSNVHMAEERGHVAEDSGMDEEDKYSGVLRSAIAPSGLPPPPFRPPGPPQTMVATPPTTPPPMPPLEPAALSPLSGGAPGVPGAMPGQLNGGAPGSVPVPAPRTAWTNAGASVAVVSGAGRSQPASHPTAIPAAGRGRGWERPAQVKTSAPTQPIAIVDTRKEHNKIRQQLTEPKKDRSSPYGTPKLYEGLKSPLASPLVGNASVVEALDLNPGVAKVDPEARRAFLEFKRERAKQRQAGDAAGAPQPSDSGLSVSSEASYLADAARLDDERPSSAAAKPDGLATPPTAPSTAHASPERGVPGPAPPAPPQQLRAGSPAVGGPGGASPAAALGAAASTAGDGVKLAAAGEGGAAGSVAPARAPSPASSTAGSQQGAFKLNPFAKEFKLSAGAREFVPGGGGAPQQGPPPSPARSVTHSVPSRPSSAGGWAPGGGRGYSSEASSSSGRGDGRREYRQHHEGGPGGKHHPGSGGHHHSQQQGHQGPLGGVHMGGPMPMGMQHMAGGWVPPQAFMPGQPFMGPMVPGSPAQQQQMMAAYAQQMGARGPYVPGPGGAPAYALMPGAYGMMAYGPVGSPGGNGRPQMYPRPYPGPPPGAVLEVVPPHGGPNSGSPSRDASHSTAPEEPEALPRPHPRENFRGAPGSKAA